MASGKRRELNGISSFYPHGGQSFTRGKRGGSGPHMEKRAEATGKAPLEIAARAIIDLGKTQGADRISTASERAPRHSAKEKRREQTQVPSASTASNR
jgi:hypothetical protein